MNAERLTHRYWARFREAGVMLLCATLFLAGGCLTAYWKNVEQQDRERQLIASKVSMVMNFFHCQDPEIHAAIMETFDPVLVAILTGVESQYRVDAVSPKGCRGLMQLSPDKLENWRDKRQNILTGSRYLQELLLKFGSVELAVAAYNAGPKAVVKYRGVPPYRETRRYVEKTRLFASMVGHAICFETGMLDRNRRSIAFQAAL
jgi:hypothetical protein